MPRWSPRSRIVLTIAISGFVAVCGVHLCLTLAWAESEILRSKDDSSKSLPGLSAPVKVVFDALGVPTMNALTRTDAMHALGYITARDRLFQMDWLRRTSAGRLAEIAGKSVVPVDIQQRVLGTQQMAQAIVKQLPAAQLAVLEAYAEGVNAFVSQAKALPFEFHLLGYRPDRWTVADSVLVLLGMFHPPKWMIEHERMVTIMKEVLPPDVFNFLTWDLDPYTAALLRERQDVRLPDEMPPIPVESLASLKKSVTHQRTSQAPYPLDKYWGRGSNGWALAPSKTATGRAMLASDMHLPISIPNIWYRVRLRYGTSELNGVVVPGIPVVIVGTNGSIAWSFTDPFVDALDLVMIETSPDHPGAYRKADGWKPYGVRHEVVKVKGGPDLPVDVKVTTWGPIAQRTLLEKPVAVHWVPMDPHAADFGLLHMDQANTIHEAITVMNQSRGPAMSAVLADNQGHIAWTLMGRVPLRMGLTGFSSVSWNDGAVGWQGYIRPEALPRIVDPPSGYVVAGNHRMVGAEYPHTIGHDFPNGYRGHRITERLKALKGVTEADMLALQLDTVSQPSQFYRQLALDILAKHQEHLSPSLEELQDVLAEWNGQADVDSVGLGFLLQIQRSLKNNVFEPYLAECRTHDQDFSYWAGDTDMALRRLLTAKIPSLLPDADQYPTWDAFLLSVLQKSVKQILEKHEMKSLKKLKWGDFNRQTYGHPLIHVFPGLTGVLGLPNEAMPGCGECVRASSGVVGATERLVVSPGHLSDALFEMPGGQSGDPLSPHYRDHHRAWVEGLPTPLLPGPVRHTLSLRPE
ncbi:MAG: peptidase [Nitrospirales bacterium]|nr:MAG: peptidase [Nitrospirales bacterium]